MRTTPRVPTLFAALAAMALFAACGDDDGDDDDDDDDIDAAVDAPPEIDAAPDAPPAVATRISTIALTDIAVTNALPAAFSGAGISVQFIDTATITTPPAYCTPGFDCGAIGSCVVTVYDVGEDAEPEAVNEGTVTITGAQQTIPPCNFIAAAGSYACPAQSAAFGAAATITPAAGQGLITDAATTFNAAAEDMYVQITGAAVPQLNALWPVLDRPGPNNIVIPFPAPAAISLDGATFTFFAGAGPTPAQTPFLADGDTITVDKAAGDGDIEAFTEEVDANGPFELSSTSATPEALPDTAEAVTFTCGGDGDCGEGPILVGFAISGRTTDGDTSVSANPLFMPAPETQYATFQCSILGDSITLDAAALAAILGTNPTRIETRVIRAGVNFYDSEDNEANQVRILAGHGLVGFTSIDQD
jgi:hypothetical protein